MPTASHSNLAPILAPGVEPPPKKVVAAYAPLAEQRRFFVGLFWRAGIGFALLAVAAFLAAPWLINGRPIAIVGAASALGGAIASVVVARTLHGRHFALRYAIAAAVALVAGGVALYLVELPATAFVIAVAIVFMLLGLLFYRAEDVARTRAVDEPGRAALELVGGLLAAIPRWLVAAIRRDD